MGGDKANFFAEYCVFSATKVTAFTTDAHTYKLICGQCCGGFKIAVPGLFCKGLNDGAFGSWARWKTREKTVWCVDFVEAKVISVCVVASGTPLVECNGGGFKGVVPECAIGVVFCARIFGGFEVALWKPLFSVYVVRKSNANFLLINGCICRFWSVGLKTDIVLLVSPTNHAGDAKLTKEQTS